LPGASLAGRPLSARVFRLQRRLAGIRKDLEFRPKFSKFRFLACFAYAHPCMQVSSDRLRRKVPLRFWILLHHLLHHFSGVLWPSMETRNETNSLSKAFQRRGGTGLGGQPGAAAGALDGSGTARTRRRAHDTRGPLARAQAAARAHARGPPTPMGIGAPGCPALHRPAPASAGPATPRARKARSRDPRRSPGAPARRPGMRAAPCPAPTACWHARAPDAGRAAAGLQRTAARRSRLSTPLPVARVSAPSHVERRVQMGATLRGSAGSTQTTRRRGRSASGRRAAMTGEAASKHLKDARGWNRESAHTGTTANSWLHRTEGRENRERRKEGREKRGEGGREGGREGERE
jgi:hypothetical protein